MEDIFIENLDRFKYAKLARLKVIEKEVATIILNGAIQNTQKVPQIIISCPNCDNVLYQMKEGIDITEVYNELLKESESLEGVINYCPNCGQKLKFKREVVSNQ